MLTSKTSYVDKDVYRRSVSDAGFQIRILAASNVINRDTPKYSA